MFKRCLIYSAIVFQLMFSLASADNFRPTHIHTVNVFSGVPQPSDEGAVRTGGFGDVAANVIGALELKQRFPELQVRLLVTSANTRHDPIVPTTCEILKIMVPSLNPNQKNQVQDFRGVEVIFLDVDFTEALKDLSPLRMRRTVRQLMRSLSRQVPPSDLNLNFSHFPGASGLLRLNTQLAIGIEEVAGSGKLINETLAPGEDSGKSPFVELSSGPNALGFMLQQTPPDASANQRLIKEWFATQDYTVPENFRVQMAYSAEWQSTQVYINALSNLRVPEEVYLFIKAFPELNTSALPPNIHLIPIRGMPFEVMDAIIYESLISPLVTGDISWGRSLRASTLNKNFVYESPWWKLESSARMRGMLARSMGVRQRELDGLFLRTEVLQKMDQAQLWEKGLQLAHILSNSRLQAKLHGAIIERLADWDVIQNVMVVADGVMSSATPTRLTEDSKITKLIAELKERFIPNTWRRLKKSISKNYNFACDLALSVIGLRRE